MVRNWQEIDWTDEDELVSENFTVRDAVWLPQWGRLAEHADGFGARTKMRLQNFLLDHADAVVELLGAKPPVHSCYRPKLYNALPAIGGAPGSAHVVLGNWAALDFGAADVAACDAARELLAANAEALGIRVEDRPGSNWVHFDSKPISPGGSRYFKP